MVRVANAGIAVGGGSGLPENMQRLNISLHMLQKVANIRGVAVIVTNHQTETLLFLLDAMLRHMKVDIESILSTSSCFLCGCTFHRKSSKLLSFCLHSPKNFRAIISASALASNTKLCNLSQQF
ncbi:MAG: hypothetical protein WAM14_05490 [Candidatus Nitrosopolaris sp.]